MNINTRGAPLGSNPAGTRALLGLGAIIVALVATTGIVAVRADRNNAAPVAQAAPASSRWGDFTPAIARPVLIFYLVDAQEQADMANAAEAEAQVVQQGVPGAASRSYRVISVTTPEEQLETTGLIGSVAAELGEVGTWDFEVVDLRAIK